MSAENVKKAAGLLKEAMELLSHGPLSYYLEQLCASQDRLIRDFAPFKVGERVAINCTPEISDGVNWGWLCGKTFLVKGATAIVRQVEMIDGRFRFLLAFDDDHWIHPHTKKRQNRKPDERGLFGFDESKVESLSPNLADARNARSDA